MNYKENQQKDRKEQFQRILNQYSADYMEIHWEDYEGHSVAFSGKELENVGLNQSQSGNIRIYHKGIWSFLSFNDSNDDLDSQHSLESKVQKAMENLKEAEGLPIQSKVGLKEFEAVVDRIETEYQIDPREIPLKEKVASMKDYNDKMLKNSEIQSTRSVYQDSFKECYFANSEGSFIESKKLFTGLSLSAMARDGMNVQRGHFTDAGYRGFEIVQDRHAECEKAVETALDLLKAKPLEKGQYHVLLDPRMTGVFAHEAFGHFSEADHLSGNESLQNIMSLGRELGTEELNIIDDGSIKGLCGYSPYDDEGVEARRTSLIEKGVLKARLNSRETAFQLGEELSGNARHLNPLYPPIVRMTNTFIDKGKYSLDELLSMMDNGIYCVDYLAGMTNLELFTFTAGRAFEVKNGKIGKLFRDVVLTGNVFETLKQIRAIGNDLQHFGGLGGCGKAGQGPLPVTVGGPHVYIENLVLGGN